MTGQMAHPCGQRDETALAAIGRRLEALPGTTRAWVVAEIDNESERQTFDTSASVDVIWVNRRGGAPGSGGRSVESAAHNIGAHDRVFRMDRWGVERSASTAAIPGGGAPHREIVGKGWRVLALTSSISPSGVTSASRRPASLLVSLWRLAIYRRRVRHRTGERSSSSSHREVAR
jgi:hypothetical protein